MSSKRLIPLFVLALCCAAGSLRAEVPAAADDSAGRDGVRIYEVKKGDTLWGISKKFIEDPYYWPDLWANNPEIRNPHFIFPDQKIRIYSGPIMIVPAAPSVEPPAEPPPVAAAPPDEPAPVREAVAPPPAPEPVVTIVVPAGVGYVDAAESLGVGRVYDFRDERLMNAAGDGIFARMHAGKSAQPGERYEIVSLLDAVRHPTTGKKVGYLIQDLGALEVTAIHPEVIEGKIVASYLEVERGALLLPYSPPRKTVELRKTRQGLQGVVLASSSHKLLQGQADVIYIDLGAKAGVEVGNLIDIVRPRSATMAVKAERGRKEARLPDEPLGQAIVVEVKPETATAAILKSVSPIEVGDKVLSPGVR